MKNFNLPAEVRSLSKKRFLPWLLSSVVVAALVTLLTSLFLTNQSNADAGVGLPTGGQYQVQYSIVNQWNNGAVFAVTIYNTSATPVKNWTISWQAASTEKMVNAWNATCSANGSTRTCSNMTYNATINGNSSVNFGGQITTNGTANKPVSFVVNGVTVTLPNGTVNATATPTKAATATPTKAATATPTKAPTATPTKAPTATPTKAPTATPTKAPTSTPVASTPTPAPTTQAPAPPPPSTQAPTVTAVPPTPTVAPVPTATPTQAPVPTATPTQAPVPTATPTAPPSGGTPKVIQVVQNDDWSMPSYAQKNSNSGFYQYPGGASRVPGTSAELVDIRWKDVNPQDGVYDWSVLTNALQKYSGGIWLRWRLTDNIHLPSWLRQKYPDIGLMRYPYGTPYSDAYAGGSTTSPGDFAEVWREGYNIEFRKLMDSFRQQGFAANPKIKFSYFPGGWKWSEFDLNFAPQMAAKGLTPDGYMVWFKRHVEDWIAGFGEDYKYKLVFTGVDEQQYAWGNTQWAQAIGRQMSAYAVSRGLGARDGYTEMFNYVLTNVPDWGTTKVTLGDGNYMITNDNAPLLSNPKLIFGTENECFIGCGASVSAANYYQAMKLGTLKALQLRMNWINTSEDQQDVSKYPDFFKFVSLSLGKQVTDSPDAWVALREGYDSLDTNKWWVRNFERWLTQREVAPNGKTVRTQSMDWGSDNGTSYEARRTDHATGNDYIYFDVNDAFMEGGSNLVQVKVTYLDNFSGTWGLEYDAADGNVNKRVTTTGVNDGKWKTVTFELPDATFQNRETGNMDFRLFNDDQHDLTASFVRVIKP